MCRGDWTSSKLSGNDSWLARHSPGSILLNWKNEGRDQFFGIIYWGWGDGGMRGGVTLISLAPLAPFWMNTS